MTDPTNTKQAYRKLYKNHGTSIGYWEGWVEGDASEAKVVFQYAKTLDGKTTRREYQAQRKNVGRSNETTCLEQAQLELDSRTSKQLDKGYVERQEDASKPSTNTLGLLKPMLAQPLEKVKPEDINWDTTWAQPKLDGHRALWKDGILYSRQGKPIHMPHVVEAIHQAGLQDLHLDGELYVHGKSLQDISSLIKRYQPGSEEVSYFIYDTISEGTWDVRIDPVAELLFQPVAGLACLEAKPIMSHEGLLEEHEKNLANGYEGTMLRWGFAGYEDGKRSKHLLKMKNFQDAEFEIIGFQEGKPYVTEEMTFQVPVWVCQTPAGETFTCTAQGDRFEKHALWETRSEHIGKQLTVKYHYLSKDGIPQLPVALRFREDI